MIVKIDRVKIESAGKLLSFINSPENRGVRNEKIVSLIEMKQVGTDNPACGYTITLGIQHHIVGEDRTTYEKVDSKYLLEVYNLIESV